MARNPSYFEGTVPRVRPLRVRPGRAKKFDLVANDPSKFSKALVLGFAIAILLGVFVMFGAQSAFHGDFGVWERVHGGMWGVQNLVYYLENQGLAFDVGEPDDVVELDGPALQLQFAGYQEMFQQIDEERDQRLRMHRLRNAQQLEHSVFVMRYQPNHEKNRFITNGSGYYGAYWRWGMFIFRGDSRHIKEIREALE